MASTSAGSVFLQPIDFHVEAADPRVKLGLDRLALVAIATATIAKQGLGAIKELLLPLADLDGVELIRLGKFGEGPSRLGGLQGNLDFPRNDASATAVWASAENTTSTETTPTFDKLSMSPKRILLRIWAWYGSTPRMTSCETTRGRRRCCSSTCR